MSPAIADQDLEAVDAGLGGRHGPAGVFSGRGTWPSPRSPWIGSDNDPVVVYVTPAVVAGGTLLREFAKDAATVVVLIGCTVGVIAVLLMMVYVWHYALAATVVVVAVLAFQRRLPELIDAPVRRRRRAERGPPPAPPGSTIRRTCT